VGRVVHPPAARWLAARAVGRQRSAAARLPAIQSDIPVTDYRLLADGELRDALHNPPFSCAHVT